MKSILTKYLLPYFTLAHRRFTFRGNSYRYFVHPYNHTWANERAVEIPIIWEMLKTHPKRRTLEVGNVLAHYDSIAHQVLDKYEHAPGVINQDVAEFQASMQYEFIVSISTLEHVGWDEEPRRLTKLLVAIENLKRHLAPGGMMVATCPLGYNPVADDLFIGGDQTFEAFSEVCYLRRISLSNQWVEVERRDAQGACYGSPFPFANALAIGYYQAPTEDHAIFSHRT